DAKAGWVRRVGLPAVWFGLAVLAKASGLVYGVLCLTFLELERLARTGAFTPQEGRSRLRQVWSAVRPLRRELTQIVALGTVRAKSLANWAILTAAALILFSLTFRVQIGIRMVFPVVVLLVLGLAAAVVHACRGPLRRNVLAGLSAAGVLWAAWSATAVWPHGLCYVNELWGGTREG